jgi:ABC-type uncharacterized transport system fused permease/ATPase subunit
MKKKIITLIAFVMLTVTASFANGTDVSKYALTTFAANFAKATDVKWETADTYYKASFLLNGQTLNALISEEGELIAISRNLLSTELPVNLQVSLTKILSGYWISDLAEYAIDGETRYYMTIENADRKIILQNFGTYSWTYVKETAK